MKLLEEYAEHAKGCRAAAAKAQTVDEKNHLLQMAERWEELARQRAAQLHLEDILATILKSANNGDTAAA
jgi:hypothetical protein